MAPPIAPRRSRRRCGLRHARPYEMRPQFKDLLTTELIQINRRLSRCAVCIVVVDAEEIDQSWSTLLSRRYRMSTLDEITKEKQRLGEALARVDTQREKLVSELNELEATER